MHFGSIKNSNKTSRHSLDTQFLKLMDPLDHYEASFEIDRCMRLKRIDVHSIKSIAYSLHVAFGAEKMVVDRVVVHACRYNYLRLMKGVIGN